MEVGEREIIYLSLHCHHQNDFCIKVGSDESCANICYDAACRVSSRNLTETKYPTRFFSFLPARSVRFAVLRISP